MSDSTYSSTFTAAQLPRQKLPISKKTDSWRRQCIDAALHIVGIYDSNRRSTRARKQKNYDLLNGKFNRQDLEYAANPLGIEVNNLNWPATMQPYDCWNPIFQTLFGEEAKRQMSFIVRAINDDAISEKEEEQKEQILQILQQTLQKYIENPEENPEVDEQLQKYSSMNYQDMRESIATKILTYLKKSLNLDMMFQKGWEDALVAGEEIYAVETYGGEPSVRRVNPLELYFQLPHNSDMIDDAEVIVEHTYMSISQIIDVFYDKLTPSEVEQLEGMLSQGDNNFLQTADVIILKEDISMDSYAHRSIMSDHKGNLRVFKVTWKSKKKVGKLSYIDPTTGEQLETIVSEDFKVDKENPNEHVEWMWINEYWEGYKIGNDMYLEIKPKRLQYRRIDNISACKSGYAGTVYNCNNSQSVSLMDRLTPFIYLYIIMWYRLELAISKNKGKIALIDVALIPDGWEMDKWLYYAETMGITFTNSFNEGKKGQATGKLAGNMSHSGNQSLDLETGNFIQHIVTTLQFIEQKLQKLSGVSDQRMGDITPSELVGNTERAVIQSSNITERWFQIHNYTKQRTLELLIEAAKHVWSQKSKKIQYVTDDMATVFFSVDGPQFNNAEYGVFVSNSIKDQEALNIIKQLMQVAIQNDKVELSSVIDVLSSESTADIKNKLLNAEAKRAEQIQASQQQQLEHEQMLKQMELEEKQKDRDLDQYIADENNRTKIEVQEIANYFKAADTDSNNNGIPDPIELANHALERQRLESDMLTERMKNDREAQKHISDLQVKQRELLLKEKELLAKQKDTEKKAKTEKDKIEAQKKIEKLKADTAIKVAKMKPKPANKKK